MKKLLVLLTILISTFVIDVSALEYYTVNITSSFEENIDFSEVPLIKLFFYSEGNNLEDDVAVAKDIVELNEKNNYSAILKEIYINDTKGIFAMVDKDNLGKYNCELHFSPMSDGIVNLDIKVTRNITTNQSVEIPKNILENIYGTTITTNNSSISNEDATIENNNNNEKKEQEMQEKEEKIKNNNKITIALFIIIGIILLLSLIYISVKIVNANK